MSKIAKTNSHITLVGFFVLLAGSASAATEIAFTGLDAANPTNLSAAANWSATPGADTIGVIDLSQTPAQGYVVNADLALSGRSVMDRTRRAHDDEPRGRGSGSEMPCSQD